MNISSASPQTSAITLRPSPASDQSPRLNESDLKLLTQLKARDREVRAHEAAHQAAGGQHAGAMALTYEQGPDGVQYAVGGEVPISVSAVSGDPQATVEKMRTVRAAAMAPAQPSSADLAVAAQAMQTLQQAQMELADPAVQEPLGARQARDTYARVSAFGDDNSARTSGFLNISV
ncbi:hypothetical protein MIH18_19735 [Marinobacter sp. M3C]|jgi:hypothetical protein|uniref:putative metalloprotease CJM1_0395 family protein n=1 Tax=unclassified Marinobacter TaxID=83889 RepID=UPI00200E9662|nr:MULTISPECIES: putative metalloprotease CJM1_0395 family protein [unclassified Marinobacter]MCL1477522.1 hypothetical protein [Marinobacter sp.]MCL1481628.1 hypothetical protein [Marinobacter sp.]MCL1487034.1 hypothetical protein [Marinobacter sp.]UQG54712.1 hypothetical protein MIH16_14910 [Marinobacter sp. M4C]UQG59916.1 hypothetical protein MIH18_19735 [Marinobacter sp. M3C]